ncbi:hypothetical protein QR680_015334 [Steinernema hermaphroditum]|uniref:Uncharacterized protein n=1 Tax=Steinernema hermaphroditum TaxID=289476 RepID=A0AA39H987_9BILA|nr:hypothetical protein QR680_015334 [Steinernema hermaphroditum]
MTILAKTVINVTNVNEYFETDRRRYRLSFCLQKISDHVRSSEGDFGAGIAGVTNRSTTAPRRRADDTPKEAGGAPCSGNTGKCCDPWKATQILDYFSPTTFFVVAYGVAMSFDKASQEASAKYLHDGFGITNSKISIWSGIYQTIYRDEVSDSYDEDLDYDSRVLLFNISMSLKISHANVLSKAATHTPRIRPHI